VFLVRTLISASESHFNRQSHAVFKERNTPCDYAQSPLGYPPQPKGQRDKGLFVLKKHKSAFKENLKDYKI